ncbi:hypothetical protein AKJ16_DCAP15729 [Drosera capensis]
MAIPAVIKQLVFAAFACSALALLTAPLRVEAAIPDVICKLRGIPGACTGYMLTGNSQIYLLSGCGPSLSNIWNAERIWSPLLKIDCECWNQAVNNVFIPWNKTALSNMAGKASVPLAYTTDGKTNCTDKLLRSRQQDCRTYQNNFHEEDPLSLCIVS